MEFHERPGLTMRDAESLYRLRPKVRVIAGMILIAVGIGVTVLLWNRGVLWGLPGVGAVTGIFLFLSGLSGMRKEKERAAFLATFEARKDELLDGMVAEKREGRNPIRWLNDQGIHDGEIRSLLIEGMNERFQRPSGK